MNVSSTSWAPGVLKHTKYRYGPYGPYANPRYAVSIIVEHGGSGSTTAAPIAKKIFKLVIDRHDLREKNRLEKFTNT